MASANEKKNGASGTRTDDGRRQRSEQSREKIIAAMFSLIGEGHVNVSAAQVAQRSGVSIRTVFRQFEEVDEIYRQIIARLEEELMPTLLAPYQARGWKRQLAELINRRAEIYEYVMPFKVSSAVRRFKSVPLMDDHARFVTLERAALKAVLPDSITCRPTWLAAIDNAVSFEAWRRLRQDLKLEPEAARDTLQFSIRALISEA
jgi:AcrR family transcriptional regulator